MSIFQHPLLLVFFSFLLCPVASQTGHYGPKEVKSGHCTSAELVKTAADCQAAAKALGLKGTMWGMTSDRSPPGCIWANNYGSGYLRFNTDKASATACGHGTYSNPMCLCVDPCPIGNYQNEESSKTCKSCRPGTYNDETGQALCKRCLPGTYNDETGRALCQNCTIGKYNNEIGEATCRNCPAGQNSATGASNCQPNCCHAKANYPTYETDCNTITDAAACSDRLHHLEYTCDWNCDVTTVMDMHNVSHKYLRD